MDSGWWEDLVRHKEELKSAEDKYGEQCVMISGALLMLMWCADNLDTLLLVGLTNYLLKVCLIYAIFQVLHTTDMLHLVKAVDQFSWMMFIVLAMSRTSLHALTLPTTTVVITRMQELLA